MTNRKRKDGQKKEGQIEKKGRIEKKRTENYEGKKEEKTDMKRRNGRI